MTSDRTSAIEALLLETEAAHGAYETAELKGEYDAGWPRWYAQYAVDHGIGRHVGRDVDADELASFLATAWEEYGTVGAESAGPWSGFIARRIADAL
jgi:hypothetical protein